HCLAALARDGDEGARPLDRGDDRDTGGVRERALRLASPDRQVAPKHRDVAYGALRRPRCDRHHTRHVRQQGRPASVSDDMESTMSDRPAREAGKRPMAGAAMAAYLAAGIGAFALGLIAFLNAIGLIGAPTLYAPAGGVTGRTALGVVVWLIAWAILHARWKDRDADT